MTHGAVQSLALAVGLGSAVMLICARLRFPAVLPLLLAGVLVGESGFGWVHGDSMGEGLSAFITVAVCLLVFEGSLHLDRHTIGHAPRAVWGLLTIGVIVTWAGVSALGKFVLGLDWPFALVLGAILIVTGPTVIQPILRRLPLKPGVHSALMAEGILIDPIGAVIAVATLEVVLGSLAGESTRGAGSVVGSYVFPLVMGAAIGAVIGWISAQLMARTARHEGGGEHHLNLFAMAACMVSVGASEMLLSESGLVAAAVCGVIIANTRIVGSREVRQFKEQISGFLVGTAFILLASRFEIQRLTQIDGGVLFLAGVVLLVRPISVVCSTLGSKLSWAERTFASFLAPRGIVAASVASIAAIRLAAEAHGAREARIIQQAETIETAVFLVIVVTVAFAGLLSYPVASLLRVRVGSPNGIIIVGGHRLGRDLALALIKLGVKAKIIDSNESQLAACTKAGIPTLSGDATDSQWLEDEAATPDMGWLFAATDNEDVDTILSRWGERRFGKGHSFRWSRDLDEPRPGTPALQPGRPLRHLLFQMDIQAARVETWEGPKDGTVPFAVWEGDVFRIIPWDQTEQPVPEGATAVGLRFGPPDEPQADEPGTESDPSSSAPP